MKRIKVFVPLGALLSVLLTAIGTFKSDEGLFTTVNPQLGEWVIVLVAILVAAVIVWVVGSRAVREGGNPSPTSLVLAVLGVLSIAVFWLGLPSVFAAGAAATGLEAKDRGSKTPGTIALVLAGLTVIFAIYIAFTG